MGKIYFLFGVHNHQPVGNFDHVFKESYDNCYLPFISVLKKYPAVKCNLHISGPLYDWILKNEKGFIDIISSMVANKQLEIMSSGYYEPILPIISDNDKYRQIDKMNRFIKKQFNQKAQGIWIAERVWEPYLPKIIHNANLKYAFLDDTHFRYAGINEDEFFGYYTTEDSFKPVYIFPISKSLRYKIPFSKAHEAIDLLKSFVTKKDRLVTLFDDGEKFGVWPGTFEWVYKKRWLDDFFTMLTDNQDCIETVTGSQALEKFKSQGLVYLPTASYEEMGEWALSPKSFDVYEELKSYSQAHSKADEFKNFVRGGFFRNFYEKYPRLNYMHKRMFYISEKINELENAVKDNKIMDSLMKAQCNCGYWHGVFGGFYLAHIRAAIFENILNAEKLYDKKLGGGLSCECSDFDFDGNKEVILKNNHLVCVLSERGGCLKELSFKDINFNFLNTITRKEESYHNKIRETSKSPKAQAQSIHDVKKCKQDDLDQYLIYDNYEKCSLIDHVLDNDIDIDKFYKQNGFFTLDTKSYAGKVSSSKKAVSAVYNYDKDGLSFSKKIGFDESAEFSINYKFDNKELLAGKKFAVEFNFFFQSPEHAVIKSNGKEEKAAAKCQFDDCVSLNIKDSFKKAAIDIKCSSCKIFMVPVYSVSSSESGFERVYQQTTLLFIKESDDNDFNIDFCLRKEG